MTHFLLEQLFILFFILTLGTIIGSISFKGFSLGSAGVLFVALIFGHFGMSVHKDIMDIGLILFVYSVGLSAGPNFLRSFKKDGLKYITSAFVVNMTGALIVSIFGIIFKLSPALIVGIYTGSQTCTPAFATVLDIIRQQIPEAISILSIGYGVAYPYGMIGVVLLINLLPKILRVKIKEKEEEWSKKNRDMAKQLKVKYFKVTNPNCDGKKIREITPKKFASVTFSRIKHNNDIHLVGPDTVLYLGDIVIAVGTDEELESMRFIIGEEIESIKEEKDTNIISQDIEVIDHRLLNKPLMTLGLWERYGIRLTRIRRQGFEMVPNGNMELQMGDIIRIVGSRKDVESFVKEVSGSSKKINETSMGTFLAGILIGTIIGMIPLRVIGDITIRLGMAGGVFITSLFIGHFRKIGRFYLYVPNAARSFSREFGIMLFLAGVGTTAGKGLLEILKSQGLLLLCIGFIVTTFSCIIGIFVMLKILKFNILESMGILTASMTNPPALKTADELTTTEIPTISYAATYPAGLIFKIIIAQVLFQLLEKIL